MRAMRVVLAVLVACLVAPGAAALAAPDPIDTSGALPDIEVKGSIAPTKSQRASARRLGEVAWNQFGTPSSVVDRDGALATVAGDSAVAAARVWLERNKALFKLSSTDNLVLASDSKLAGSNGHAVSLVQTVGGLRASGGGLVTIGVTKVGGGWRIVSASSTINGDETLAAKPQLKAESAWQKAAANVGLPRGLAQIHRSRRTKLRGWRSLKVAGLADVQQARPVAFPTVASGYVPAYETIVIDTSESVPTAYRSFVDARSGKVLARESMVDNADDRQLKSQTFNYSGSVPATNGACDVKKGPYTVTAGTGVRAIDTTATADNPDNDIVLNLYNGTTLVAQQDTGTSPERIRYAPAGGVPAGDYFVEVCDFAGGNGAPWTAPLTYTGTLLIDDSPPPTPYQARWQLFPANPSLSALDADPWNTPSTDTRQKWCWRSSPTAGDCDRVIGNLASRTPWDVDGRTGQVTHTTFGNNAVTAESWLNGGQPGPHQFRPTSAGRDYSFPWSNDWSKRDCNPSGAVVGQSFDVAAAVTNLFTMHNRMHDWSYLLGFTEENWNAQLSNFGLTPAENAQDNDPVLGSTQAGALAATKDRDNANMTTLPDGSPSFSNMYLWQPLAGSFYAPCVDGDYDAGIIGHEYTHMIENRMIGKGNRRTGSHAGDMGEAVGDLFAIEILNEYGLVPTNGENPFSTGAYATGNKLRGIRNYAGNFPATGAFPTPSTYPQVDPLNFSDIGYDLPGPEVHSDGEIWIAVNFDIRKALAAKYNKQFPESDKALQTRCADGAQPVDQCPGNRRWIQLLTDSFLLDPTNPTMVDARNSMLAADQMRFGGANQSELWLAFARRGLGRFASSTTGTGRVGGVESDTDPLPDFEATGQGNTTITFAAVSRQTPEPAVPARIYVGHYEARISPVADTDPATNAPATASTNNLDATATFAPGTYEFVASAPGYGAVRFRRTFRAGVNQAITLHMAPNWASKGQGASASGDTTAVMNGSRVVQPAAQVNSNLIDDTENTNWQSAATQQGAEWNVNGKQATIDLAGSSPVRVSRVQVSAMLGPVFDSGARPNPVDLSQNRFTALRSFEIWTCNSRFANCANDSGYQVAYRSADDAFPADVSRPVAPMLLMREFAFSPVQATHLRLVVRNSQCTGGPAYQGEQDADPANATDCNEAGSASTQFVRVAEVQAFSQPSTVTVG
jgi:hypothetical protein